MAAVIAYTRVSTDEQAASGLGLDAQRRQIEAAVSLHPEWTDVLWLSDDGYNAKTLKRQAMQQALGALQAGDAEALVVAKLDRISRSVSDFCALVERSRREDWQLVVLDLGVDTTTATGEMVANILASLAQFERRLIGERTSAALQALKVRGTRLGRPIQLPAAVRDRIVQARRRGSTYQAIADTLTHDEVPTAQGGACWYPSTVRAVLASVELDAA